MALPGTPQLYPFNRTILSQVTSDRQEALGTWYVGHQLTRFGQHKERLPDIESLRYKTFIVVLNKKEG